jgi:hypothetical protein
MARAAAVLERRVAWAADNGVSGVVREFGSTLLRELDYTIEAYNTRRLERVLAPIEGVHVPAIDPSLSSDRVLTLEFIEGLKSTDTTEIDAAGLDRGELAQAFVRGAVQMVMIDGFFHADPQPGNIVVDLANGRLTFLDCGMVGELDLRQRPALPEESSIPSPQRERQVRAGSSKPQRRDPGQCASLRFREFDRTVRRARPTRRGLDRRRRRGDRIRDRRVDRHGHERLPDESERRRPCPISGYDRNCRPARSHALVAADPPRSPQSPARNLTGCVGSVFLGRRRGVLSLLICAFALRYRIGERYLAESQLLERPEEPLTAFFGFFAACR